MDPNKRRGPTVGLILAIVATLAAFTAIDIFLARMESSELATEARHDYDHGAALLKDGRAGEAANVLGKAHAIERTNAAYEVQLSQALISSGKLDEAEVLLEDLFERSPNDGDANLLEARIKAQQGKSDEAVAYFHRAIYGMWRSNARERKIAARLELAQYLASRGESTDLLAELLPLENEAQNDIPVMQRVAGLYLEAGSPARAENAYRALRRADPKNADDCTGLGNAQLALGNYRGAEASYRDATKLGGGAEVAPRLELAKTMAELDPTVRSLSSSEKYRRSMRVLELVRDSLNQCSQSPESKQLVADTDKILAEKIRGPFTNELAEARLAAAQQLWQTRLVSCGPSTSAGEESERLVMAKLAQ